MTETMKIYNPDLSSETELPISQNGVSAGFPSPADDFMDLKLDLNRELIKNPELTFYTHVSGDLLMIDKSIEPYENCLAVCYIDGEFTLKRFQNKGDHALLVLANKKYKPIRITPDNSFMIWGVVRYVIKKA